MQKRETSAICQVCHNTFSQRSLIAASGLRESYLELIREDNPDWSEQGYICSSCLNQYRNRYINREMTRDLGELDALEHEVAESLMKNELLSENINETYDRSLSLGERIADRVAEFGGSWAFILSFAFFLLLWVALNSFLVFSRPFDPYPYIFLNLILSMLAAVQAPIIMMSQNRQEDRDRLRAENDYQVNLKAEVEIRAIREQLDHLSRRQWSRLLEMQQIQMEMIAELGDRIR